MAQQSPARLSFEPLLRAVMGPRSGTAQTGDDLESGAAYYDSKPNFFPKQQLVLPTPQPSAAAGNQSRSWYNNVEEESTSLTSDSEKVGLLGRHPSSPRPLVEMASMYPTPRTRPLLRSLADLRVQAEAVPNGRAAAGLARGSESASLGSWMQSKLEEEPSIKLLDLLPDGPSFALMAPGLVPVSYHALRDLLECTDVTDVLGLQRGARIALLARNGPHLAAALLAVMQTACCLPLDPHSTEEELVRQFGRLGVQGVIVDDPMGSGGHAAEKCLLPSARLVPQYRAAGLFTLVSLGPNSPTARREASRSQEHCSGQNQVLVLSTSGTTGQSKAVPFTLQTLLTGAACVIKSWDLEPSDVCLNMMPLNHVGGIVRNLLGTLYSGGRLVCIPSFDPVAFWTHAKEFDATWYYAAPAMHNAILQADKVTQGVKLRMICNAAGGLPPTLAKNMRERFGCSVLPSYGMSECMPISSPPVDFDELAPTTSGLPCGPEVAIMNDANEMLGQGQEGHIVLRGPPLMKGYEQKEANESVWRPGGWFLTGDLGKLDSQGWLEVTGRCKEVIKRGGETLSPMEVEEAVLKSLSTSVVEVAAFAVKDTDFGESIAVALVPRDGQPCPGLPAVHQALRGALRPQCWPQVLLYCPRGLPKTATGKVQRAVLASASAEIVLSAHILWRDRVYYVQYQTPIQVHKQTPNDRAVELAVESVAASTRTVNSGKSRVTYMLTPNGSAGPEELMKLLSGLDDVDKPDAVVQLAGSRFPEVLPEAAPSDYLHAAGFDAPKSDAELVVARVWADLLDVDKALLSRDSDFFQLGGSSLLAGKLSSELREAFGKSLPTHVLFSTSRLKDVAEFYTEGGLSPSFKTDGEPIKSAYELVVTSTPRYASTRPVALLLQLVPTLVIFPLKATTVFLTFLWSYRHVHALKWVGAVSPFLPKWRVLSPYYLSALLAAAFMAKVVLPLVGVLLKWLLVGHVQPGRCGLWSMPYLRWWVAKQAVHILGPGAFSYTPGMQWIYLRLLGANVSWYAKINFIPPMFVEGDLLTIGPDAAIDHATIKCAALDARSSQLVLGEVILEAGCSVCHNTVVCPGSVVTSNMSLGPWTSTHELQDAKPEWRRFNKLLQPSPSALLCWFIGYPVKASMRFASWLPVLAILRAVIHGGWAQQELWFEAAALAMTRPYRIVLTIVATACIGIVSPVIYVGLLICVKWLLIGKFRPGPRTHSEMEKFRHWLMDFLIKDGDIVEFARLVGPHYQGMTVVFQLMGATVGKRVFWPGVPLNVVEFDLLEIGDDVTFGSRSVVLCSDSQEAKPVKIHSGAMLADNCLLLPGAEFGRNAMIGSGSVVSRVYKPNSIAIGNIQGRAVPLRFRGLEEDASDSTLRPFGRTLYAVDGFQAPYYVLGPVHITFINILVRLLWAPFQLGRGQWAALLVLRLFWPGATTLREALPYLTLSIMAFRLVSVIMAWFVGISMKWLLIGRRQPGSYGWDTSSYCQRWKLWTALDSVLGGGGLDLLGGSWWACLYYRLLGAEIGRNVCLYPWGASPTMTEPDLVSLGDGACIEGAHIVCHVNTLGLFELNRIRIGARCTMRDFTRVQPGGDLRPGATLLEHSLVMPGETVPSGMVWQGWPNRWQMGSGEP